MPAPLAANQTFRTNAADQAHAAAIAARLEAVGAPATPTLILRAALALAAAATPCVAAQQPKGA